MKIKQIMQQVQKEHEEARLRQLKMKQEQQKQAMLNKTHNVRSEKEMHSLVDSLAGGVM